MVVVRGTRIVLPDGERPASIHIQGDTIVGVGAYDDRSADADEIDAGDLIVSPGIVDTHVHVNEPGRTEWEGFESATRAAAAGGVTTIIDMPLNSIPSTTTALALDEKRTAARGKCHVDVGFWGGVVPGNAGELEALIDRGVRGFKSFLVPSGVDEFPAVAESDLRRAMPILARRRAPLLVHAESPAVIDSVARALPAVAREESARYSSYLATRPQDAEVAAVCLMIGLAREFSARVHIVHVACAEAVQEIAAARGRGVAITAETCPHYLTFAAEKIPDGAVEYKCAPPIRTSEHREALWRGLAQGALDLVATDHSPAPPSLKCAGDFMRAWGGIASLEVSLAATWTGAQSRGFGPDHLARWTSRTPAALAGLSARKGAIAAGHDADLVIWDPDARFIVDPDRLQQRHKLTPYAGMRLSGRVQRTIVRGRTVWRDGRLTCEGTGRFV